MEANGIPILKSGSDFQQYTETWVTLPPKGATGPSARPTFKLTRHDITSDLPQAQDVAAAVRVACVTRAECNADPDLTCYNGQVESIEGALMRKLMQVIGYTDVDLDGTADTVRTKESNLGNFVCDVVLHNARQRFHVDACIIQGGCFRSNRVTIVSPFTGQATN